MSVLVIGKGFLSDHLPYEKFTDHFHPDELTIEERIFDRYKPDVIINCIGRTGRPNVDWCESHKHETIEGNITVPTALASVAHKYGTHMIHIGSGCIYFGESPNIKVTLNGPEDTGWKETDFANPKSFYSKTKYACDLLLGTMPHVATLRIRMPITHLNTSRNLINKMLGYKDVLECPNSVTFIDDLVKVIDWTIKNRKTGIYHVANPQPMTHIDLLEEYRKYRPEHKYNKITEKQLESLVVAPRSNCILNTSKIQSEGFELTPTHMALRACMRKYIENCN